MSDLEKSIADWRRQMLAAGIKNPPLLDELESHLREEVEQHSRAGMSAEEAFKIAAQRIGQPAALHNEFAKYRAMKRTRLQKLGLALIRYIGFSDAPPILFTAAARESIDLGRKEAPAFHHDFIGTEHVLLGLLESKTGVVRGVLQAMGVDHKVVRGEIEKIVGMGLAERTTDDPPFTPRVKKALEIARSEARSLKQIHVDDKHVFLGLMLEGSGVAALVLKSFDIDVKRARTVVLKETGGIHPDA